MFECFNRFVTRISELKGNIPKNTFYFHYLNAATIPAFFSDLSAVKQINYD